MTASHMRLSGNFNLQQYSQQYSISCTSRLHHCACLRVRTAQQLLGSCRNASAVSCLLLLSSLCDCVAHCLPLTCAHGARAPSESASEQAEMTHTSQR
jgi:hypothetical protein